MSKALQGYFSVYLFKSFFNRFLCAGCFSPYSMGPTNTISFTVSAESLQNFINFHLSLYKKCNYYVQHLNSNLGLEWSIRTWKSIFTCLCNRKKNLWGYWRGQNQKIKMGSASYKSLVNINYLQNQIYTGQHSHL